MAVGNHKSGHRRVKSRSCSIDHHVRVFLDCRLIAHLLAYFCFFNLKLTVDISLGFYTPVPI